MKYCSCDEYHRIRGERLEGENVCNAIHTPLGLAFLNEGLFLIGGARRDGVASGNEYLAAVGLILRRTFADDLDMCQTTTNGWRMVESLHKTGYLMRYGAVDAVFNDRTRQFTVIREVRERFLNA